MGGAPAGFANTEKIEIVGKVLGMLHLCVQLFRTDGL